MRSSILLCLSAVLFGSGCGGTPPPNAAEIEENGAIAAENVTYTTDDRAGMLARQAADLSARAEQATGVRREELQTQANAAMDAAINVQRSGDAGAARIDAAAERAAQNASGH